MFRRIFCVGFISGKGSKKLEDTKVKWKKILW